MLYLKTEKLELRGIKNETSKKGNVYYILFAEDEGGESFKFFCRDSDAFPAGLKKGDDIVITVYINSFKDLEVKKVERVVTE